MGVLEEPFPSSHDGEGEGEGESEEVLPTLTAVIRSPSGRHVWSMQMCHHPRTSQVIVALNESHDIRATSCDSGTQDLS